MSVFGLFFIKPETKVGPVADSTTLMSLAQEQAMIKPAKIPVA